MTCAVGLLQTQLRSRGRFHEPLWNWNPHASEPSNHRHCCCWCRVATVPDSALSVFILDLRRKFCCLILSYNFLVTIQSMIWLHLALRSKLYLNITNIFSQIFQKPNIGLMILLIKMFKNKIFYFKWFIIYLNNFLLPFLYTFFSVILFIPLRPKFYIPLCKI